VGRCFRLKRLLGSLSNPSPPNLQAMAPYTTSNQLPFPWVTAPIGFVAGRCSRRLHFPCHPYPATQWVLVHLLRFMSWVLATCKKQHRPEVTSSWRLRHLSLFDMCFRNVYLAARLYAGLLARGLLCLYARVLMRLHLMARECVSGQVLHGPRPALLPQCHAATDGLDQARGRANCHTGSPPPPHRYYPSLPRVWSCSVSTASPLPTIHSN